MLDAGLLQDGFTGEPCAAGWVRVCSEAQAQLLLGLCNETSLLVLGGSPRPLLLGRSLADVALPQRLARGRERERGCPPPSALLDCLQARRSARRGGS